MIRFRNSYLFVNTGFSELDKCEADIAMLVDKSGSITNPEDGGNPGNWKVLKDFIYAVMRQTEYGVTDSTKYAVLFFANNANLFVKLNQCSDIPCAKNIIETVNAPVSMRNTVKLL